MHHYTCNLKAYLRSWSPSVVVDDVLRQQGADPERIRRRSRDSVEATERAVRDGRELVAPFVLQHHFRVEEMRHEKLLLSDGHQLAGPAITQMLAGARELVAVVCSIGSRLESVVGETMRDDPPYAVALDEYGTLAVTSLVTAVSGLVRETAHEQGLDTTIPLSPGMKGWSVAEGQSQLFRLLDDIGYDVYLTESSYMVPRKSTSFLLGIGRELEAGPSDPCDCCSVGERCRYRGLYGGQ